MSCLVCACLCVVLLGSKMSDRMCFAPDGTGTSVRATIGGCMPLLCHWCSLVFTGLCVRVVVVCLLQLKKAPVCPSCEEPVLPQVSGSPECHPCPCWC